MSLHKFRIIVEKVEITSNKIVEQEIVSDVKIKSPNNISELGLNHSQQIDILQSIQDIFLKNQAPLIEHEYESCPQCDNRLWNNGNKSSDFHSVFTDHKLTIKKQKCSSKACDWTSTPSVKSILGTSVHPDLYKLQCEYGATHSFRKSESILDSLSNKNREINNRERIKNITNQVGEALDQKHNEQINNVELQPAEHLTLQVDGGHIHDKDVEKRSFEAMVAKVYRPESIIEVTEKRNEIISKNCAASAKNDKQSTMKKHLLRAAQLQGLTNKTKITALADGAKNCWGIIKSLEPKCKSLKCILDWFHIGKKYENVIKGSPDKTARKLKESKALIWSGKVDSGLLILSELKGEGDIKKSKINGLYLYLNRNKEYLINSNEQASEGKPYTSQVAESTVEHLINDRHKRNQKMQWTRTGAHNVLQVRASMSSNEWDYIWQETIFSALGIAA